MIENVPEMVKEIDIQVHRGEESPNQVVSEGAYTRHTIIKILKVEDKDKTLKAARKKQLVIYKGAPIRLSADFSMGTVQAGSDWQEIFKVMKSKDLQPRLIYPAKLSLRFQGQIKSFPDNKKLKEFITSKHVLHEMLKGLL